MKSISTGSLTSKRRLLALTVALGGALTLAACGSGDDDNNNPVEAPKKNAVTTPPTTTCSTAGVAAANGVTGNVVCMLTSDGEIVIQLDARAPITVANFLKYVNAKYYDNTIFHRVVPGFVAQGGGYSSGFVEKTTGLGGTIKLESNVGVSNVKYTIAMARTTVFDSATSQFYFNSVDNSATLDFKNTNDPGYAAFGRVISGQTTIDKINAEPSQVWLGMDTPRTEVLLYWATQLK
ncbi:peptidylprolyl isomerase [Mitsuaria sp. GD03876]|uniref:peptidylprolyl isomerase n=1 Tax=Mitsuaria sp. GD03876 TaxID=2975399 RepID=UPI00244CBCC6|nr:peptidylprolyl isomerase [Mitsuaria sp. GD03876]MDH0863007.1 peptidylprolyl isomerase [Mitsuaria sp. GD03876]